MKLRLGALALLSVLAAPALARAADPTEPVYFTTPVKDATVGTEPRISVGLDDARYITTNTGSGDVGWPFVVFKSVDGGFSWQKTATDPPQQQATIDTDTVTLPTGRVLVSELDYAGLNFPTAVSDDNGQTWQNSNGSTTLVDQDRQWFAVGPVPKGSPAGTQPPVYLLYHNLGSGVAQHNMWVATSTDGGLTFGVPVPIAQPGSDAYLDLQCSDSGGPSNITVNPQTGRIYAFYTTRAAPNPTGQDAGGCAGPVFGQPIEFNIVNGTRVWVASSPDGSPGSWSNSLAVDKSDTNQVVSMQLAYGALDNAGNVYVAYPEAPNAYPDLEGAGVKLTWQTPDADGNLTDDKWSAPATLVAPVPHPAGTLVGGADLVHLVAGDPGRVAVAYYWGEIAPGTGHTPYYTHMLTSFDAQSATPHVVDKRVSDVVAYNWNTSEMMGLCGESRDFGPLQGVYAGLGCNRSTDVWGIAADAQCRVMATWPSGTSGGTDNNPQVTYATTQVDGPSLCASPRSLPGGSQGVTFTPGAAGSKAGGSTGGSDVGGCKDKVPPVSHKTGKVKASRKSIRLHGPATDRGCGVKGSAARKRVRSMSVAIGRRLANKKCRFLRGNGKFGPAVSCLRTRYIVAKGTSSWTLTIKGKFPKGRYVAWTRGVDIANNVERKARKRNLARFTIR